ncbi:ribosomal RNA-processing protein 14 [Actinidia eriantha]|uniref:ribosomal RNA-processing protein 14 n=1 Tax=Actinidia eriantha TaxID=165200 RepID=UPI00258743AA|nr:ribosomal RNA-processing protein 14 [Actinidia eriantha]XP_057475559.1 ribosomal RNA-processing protein 14 [Actinidia eriantha]
MKKKKQNPSTAATITATTVTATDLKSLIRNHSLFFDNLVQLIPAKFYLPSDDPKPWFQGLSKAAKAAAKHQSRENTKNSRRLRLNPENPQSSTLDSLKHRIETEKQTLENDEDEDEQDEIKPIGNLGVGDDRSVTYEELRQRLHRRIEELRGNRGTGERFRSENRERRENRQKRKRGSEVEEKSEKVEVEEDVAEASKGIEFGKVRLGGEEERVRRKKKRNVSKIEELERAKKLQEAKKDPEVGTKHSWKAAVSRAAGVKVHDDPRLLKQSAQKERRRHEKSAEKWKERVESREKVKGEKQQKRSENIADRIRQKKMRKIAKREKKLMRPGFEGRKEGYINHD